MSTTTCPECGNTNAEIYELMGDLTIWCSTCGDVDLPCQECVDKNRKINGLTEKLEQLQLHHDELGKLYDDLNVQLPQY